MNAKETQSAFIKTYLKPTLKEHRYLTSGQTWWKDRGNFFTIINLQNFSWNTKNDVCFCFNIGIAPKATAKNPLRPTYADLIMMTREDIYLPADRLTHKYKNNTGYILESSSDLKEFSTELKNDFELYILPRLEELKTLNDCITHFNTIPFLGNRFKTTITDLGL